VSSSTKTHVIINTATDIPVYLQKKMITMR